MWIWRHTPNSQGSELCLYLLQVLWSPAAQKPPPTTLSSSSCEATRDPLDANPVVSRSHFLDLSAAPATPSYLWLILPSLFHDFAFSGLLFHVDGQLDSALGPLALSLYMQGHLGDLSSLSSPWLSRILSLCLQFQTLVSSRLKYLSTAYWISLLFARLQTLWKCVNKANVSISQNCSDHIFPSCVSPFILFIWWMALLVICSLKLEIWDQLDFFCSLLISNYHQVPLILPPKEFCLFSSRQGLSAVLTIFAWVVTMGS